MRERPIIFSGPMVKAILEDRKTITRRVVKPQPPEGTEGAERQIAALTCIDAEPGTHCIDAEPGTHFWRWLEPGALSAGIRCPYGQPEDRLWVRETFVIESNRDIGGDEYKPPHDDGRPVRWFDDPDWGRYWHQPHYRATDPEPHVVSEDQVDAGDDLTRWRPSIHMPRWASRITLEVTGVRVERVQDISVRDAVAEGVDPPLAPGRDVDIDGGLWLSGQRAMLRAFRQIWDSINGKRAPWESNPWVWVVEFKRMRP